jgi:hypothetical protein
MKEKCHCSCFWKTLENDGCEKDYRVLACGGGCVCVCVWCYAPPSLLPRVSLCVCVCVSGCICHKKCDFLHTPPPPHTHTEHHTPHTMSFGTIYHHHCCHEHIVHCRHMSSILWNLEFPMWTYMLTCSQCSHRKPVYEFTSKRVCESTSKRVNKFSSFRANERTSLRVYSTVQEKITFIIWPSVASFWPFFSF